MNEKNRLQMMSHVTLLVLLVVFIVVNSEYRSQRHLYDARIRHYQEQEEVTASMTGRIFRTGGQRPVLYFHFSEMPYTKAREELEFFLSTDMSKAGIFVGFQSPYDKELRKYLETMGAGDLHEEVEEPAGLEIGKAAFVFLLNQGGVCTYGWKLDPQQRSSSLIHHGAVKRLIRERGNT